MSVSVLPGKTSFKNVRRSLVHFVRRMVILKSLSNHCNLNLKAGTAALVIVVIALIVVGGIVVYPRLSSLGVTTPCCTTGQTTNTTSPTTGSSTTGTTATSTLGSTSVGNLFAFQPPQFTGGDGPVTGADFAAHAGDTNEWLEAKIVPNGLNGTIWYVHADFVGATNEISGDWANVTTDSDPSTYPQGTASYNTQTHLLVFNVKSVPSTTNGWFHNAKEGDVIECYPFSTDASFASASNFYWSGNCELTSGGKSVSGVGHFIRTWQGGGGIDGNPIPTCYPDTLFEGVFSIVSTGGTIDITDLVCSGEPGYQVGGILWFNNGAWENIGAQEGMQPINFTANTNKGCNEVTITIPTSRGVLTADVNMDRYYQSGCAGEDASLSGTVMVGGETYQILGVMSEFRCTTGYC
jgi:hypothetical protein